MEKRFLGNNLEVSAIGLGCMGFSHAYGAALSDKETITNIRKAYDIGYTLFDTAEVYGTKEDPHCNEVLVGKALKEIRNNVQIVTKFGIHFDENSTQVNKSLITDSSRKTILNSVEASLRRLNTDHIDLYLQHRIDVNTEPEAVADVMAELIKEGKILNWGISEANEEYLRRANAICKVAAVENRYSMMYRDYESLFSTLEELNIGFIAFSPMANGFLTGKYNKDSKFDSKLDYRSNMPQFKPKAYEQNQQLLKLLADMSIEHNATPSQISMAWMLCKKPWIVPIPGSRKISHMTENVAAIDIKLSQDEIIQLDKMLASMNMSEVFGGSKIVK